MTLEQIIALTQAGFTKDDIFAMVDSNTNPNTNPKPATPQPPAAAPTAPTPAPAPAPAPTPTSVPVPEKAPAQNPWGVIQPMSENEKMMNRLLESMNNLNSTMQKSNLMADVQPKAATTEDMLAAIINPPEMIG